MAVKAWLGLVRCVMVCRGGQGKACWVELGHGGARRSRFASVWSNLVGHDGARRSRRGPLRFDGLRHGLVNLIL